MQLLLSDTEILASTGKSAEPPPSDTPMMRQWRAAKEKHPDCVIFTRVGDFYADGC